METRFVPQSCDGWQQIASENECKAAASSVDVHYKASVDTSWPQGCFIHGDGAYFGAGTQTGTNTPDGGFICRDAILDAHEYGEKVDVTPTTLSSCHTMRPPLSSLAMRCPHPSFPLARCLLNMLV